MVWQIDRTCHFSVNKFSRRLFLPTVGIGIADSNAFVYGCIGSAKISSDEAFATNQFVLND